MMRNWLHHFFDSDTVDLQHRRLIEARIEALEYALGKCDGWVFRPTAPMQRQGCANVLRFHEFVPGITYSTSQLIGQSKQIPNRWGHYELMICTRQSNEWAPQLISRLAPYTFQHMLQPGDTMDLSAIQTLDPHFNALLFAKPDPPADSFGVLGTPASLLLVIGITDAEFEACKSFGSGVVIRKLRDAGHFPYTDLKRESII